MRQLSKSLFVGDSKMQDRVILKYPLEVSDLGDTYTMEWSFPKLPLSP